MRKFRPLWSLGLLVLFLGSGPGVAGAEDLPSLPLQALEDWRWRPRHPELVRRRRVGKNEVLEAMDAATGRIRRLVDLDALRALVKRADAGPSLQRIGRPTPPDLVWEPWGLGLCLVHKGDLVWQDLQTGFRRRLTRTTSSLGDVKVAPGGRYVSFSRDHELWVVPTMPGEPRSLTSGGTQARPNAELDWLYPEEFGLHTAHWWSPDGSRVAFLQMDQRDVPEVAIGHGSEARRMRYPRVGETNPAVRVGVVAVREGRTRWLALTRGAAGPAYVPRVAWFPDSKHVAVTLLDRAQRNLSLVAATTGSSPPSRLLHEHDARWVDLPPSPTFVTSRRFLWRSARSGWTRWYLATLPAGGPGEVDLEALTKEGVEVWERPRLDPQSGEAHYVALTDDGLRRRPLSGVEGREAAFAPPAGYDVSVSFDDSATWAVTTWSRTLRPPRRDLRRVKDGEIVRRFGSALRDAFQLDTLPYPELGFAPEGTSKLTWRLWHPPGPASRASRPLVVHAYGGPGARKIRDAWDARGLDLIRRLAAEGFCVLEVDGRGAQGYGREHEREIHGRLGIREIEDHVRAVRTVAKRPGIDASRVGITGWSFGGTLTCLGMLRHPDVFKVGVAVAPVTDWRLYDTAYTERYMGLLGENEAGYEDTAATTHAGALRGRLLLLHGKADDNVHVVNTRGLIEALQDATKDELFQAVLYPDVGHGLGRFYWDAHKRMLAFFDENL